MYFPVTAYLYASPHSGECCFCRRVIRDLGSLGGRRHGCHTSLMSRFVEDIRRAVARGDLPQRFRPEDVRRACPG